MRQPTDWQLILTANGVCLGLCCDEAMITTTAYLPATPDKPPQNLLAAECLRQLRGYFRQPRRQRFDLPLADAETPHQRRARDIIAGIPAGKTMTYGGVAARLKNSSPRAVGGACRANPLPLLVPCHRVVAANGIGGFMGDGDAPNLTVKRRLLRLEGAL